MLKLTVSQQEIVDAIKNGGKLTGWRKDQLSTIFYLSFASGYIEHPEGKHIQELKDLKVIYQSGLSKTGKTVYFSLDKKYR